MSDSDPQPVSGPHDERVGRVEILISTILRVGVITSLSIVMLGIVLSFVHHREYLHSHDEFHRLTRSGAAFPHSLRQVGEGVLELRGQAVIMAGLILLIATPVLRVAISIFAFILQRDRTFVIITTIVLVLLLLSFILGKTEGG